MKKKKLLPTIIILLVIALIAGLTLVTTDFPYISGYTMQCGFNEKSNSIQIKKVAENGKFYFELMPGNIKVSCTKSQYDFIKGDGTYYLRYDALFYNKNIGKLQEITDKNILIQQ